ncbi:hypothetical protein O4H50_11380 [Vibrio diazotrophicus]|uniref:hypothetical protein n=1 Tax=Vibrio diazotrophicus TaxID=685 RepID=UPI0022AF16DF|nr:hypothetical protein [Vibrio diazotrophicus]MCZ4372395.1 hypothetical protein [Vibrio diazotrophicus]
MFLKSSGDIIDLNFSILSETFELLDSKLAEIAVEVDNNFDDESSVYDRAEHFVGLGFTVMQQYLVDTLLLTNVDKSVAYSLGPKVTDNVSLISLVNASANWWKHEAEWFGQNELPKQAESTLKRVLNISGSHDYALTNVLVFLVGDKKLAFSPLLPKLMEWRNCVVSLEK